MSKKNDNLLAPQVKEGARVKKEIKPMSHPPKPPPSKAIKSLQYDLFSQFVTNDSESVSNTIELWESIPKYFFTPAQVKKLRTPDGLASPFKQPYVFKGIDCEVTIHPALIEQEGGYFKAFFPGVTEELVEEALKKILADQNYGIHDPIKSETWVKFSLKMVQRELERRGKSRSISEVKHAIQVMSLTNLTLSKGKKQLWSGSILQDLLTVDREEYKDDFKALHAARLPLFISNAIDKLEYRQFNIDRLMNLNTQLTRWLYKRLIHRYKQADIANNYHFRFLTVKEESNYLGAKLERQNRHKMAESLKQLKAEGVLSNYEVEEIKEGRSIVDVKYTVTASLDFRKEQKAANAAASKRRLIFADKSK